MIKGADINQLYAEGDIISVNQLIGLLYRFFPESYMSISEFNSTMNSTSLSLSFVTHGGFPKDIFSVITKGIDKSREIQIRVMHDGFQVQINEEFVFSNGKWNFEEALPNISLHDKLGTVFTSGAYIVPFSYTSREGKTCFAWMVTGFEADTHCNGLEIDVYHHGTTLAELTPAPDKEEEDNELPPKESIQRMLLNYGVTKLDLDEYCKTGYGYIVTVYTEMVEYSHGDTEEYENLDDNILEDLAIAVEMQIEANEKAFKRCQN